MVDGDGHAIEYHYEVGGRGGGEGGFKDRKQEREKEDIVPIHG